LSSGPVDDAYQDQMAAQFPLGAMVVARLLKAAGLLVAEPRPVIMPDDARLGEHRERFAGRMGWIEERPNEEEDDRPGFAGSRRITGTLTLYENLREDPSSHVDDEAFLQARLIDFLVGDWDRHYDNWRWAAYEGPDGTLWEPISRDRDWAFARIDGILPWIVRWYYPKYVGFGADYPAIKGLAWSSQNLDRRLLNERDAADFHRVASGLQTLLTDEALAGAVSVLPPAYQERVGERMLSELKARRDALPDAAREFYDLLSGWVDVRATDEPDSVSVELVDEGLRVSLAAGSERRPRYERIFLPEETNEIRIYLYGGDDVVSFPSGTNLPIRLRVVAGDGRDEARIADAAPLLFGNRDRDSGNVLLFADDPMPLDLEGLDEEEVEELTVAGYQPTLVWDTRDWGHEWIPTPTLDYASEFGLHLGATITRRGFGFGNAPYESQLSLTAMGASSPNRLVLEGSYERLLGPRSGWRLEADGRWLTQRLTRFWGFGNETTNLLPQESYETRRSLRDFEVVLRYHPLGSEWSAWAGPRVRRWGRTHVAEPTVFQLFPAPGSEATTLLGGVVGLERDTRDSVDDPRRGSWLRLEGAAYPGVADSPDSWGSVRLAARRYVAAESVPGRPALHLGIFSETAGADAPYFERASLGGQTTRPGYRTGRFRGDLAVSSLALVRATLLDLQTLGGLAFGGHGLVAGGRVWLAGEDSEVLHYATGGGFWIRSGALGKLFSVTFARGDRGFRTYLDLGFPF
ncbi:MAG: hypothetical protein HKO53_20070, partial [Gemmatimonadetes bacterium]|nr:hypothetical protein [Gemmatimonadota bacterium]